MCTCVSIEVSVSPVAKSCGHPAAMAPRSARLIMLSQWSVLVLLVLGILVDSNEVAAQSPDLESTEVRPSLSHNTK